MKANKVPNDLLPMHTLHLQSNNWAAKTFRYWSAFHVGTLPQVPDENDLRNWRDSAADIIEELKALGVSKAQTKVCNMVNSYFTFDYHKTTTFSSLYDVVDMLSDPDFYKENMTLVRDMLHMFQYGIFRSGYNGWAYECANEWMRDRNIEYLHLNTGKKARTGKGFVYKLIVQRASNSLCERLQNMSQRIMNEYVVVRDRKIKKFGDNYQLETYVFNYRFKAYLCRLKESYEDEHAISIPNNDMTNIMKVVQAGKKKGMTMMDILNGMKKMVSDYNVVGKFKCAYYFYCKKPLLINNNN